jgi:broad specificity phosphatase PhoE
VSSTHAGLPAVQLPGESETLLYLVRHAETAWNVERRFQGQLDVPLSSTGERQAVRVAGWFAAQPVRFSAIYSSDLRRAMDTAQTIAPGLGLMLTPSQELRELNCGTWQGLTVVEVEERFPGELQRWREDVCGYTLPGGESIPDVQRRMSGYMADVVSRHRGEAIIVVSHGASLSAYIAAINGWDLQETWDARRARMSNTGVTAVVISHTGYPPRTLYFNSVAHLPGHADLASVIDPFTAPEKDKTTAEFAV